MLKIGFILIFFVLCNMSTMGDMRAIAKAEEEKVEEEKSDKSDMAIGFESDEIKEAWRMKQMLAVLDDTNHKSFESTVYQFVKMGKGAVPFLLKKLVSSHSSETAKLNTIYTLGRVGSPAYQAIPSIVPFLRSQSIDLKLTSARALGRMGKRAAKYVPDIGRLLNSKDASIRGGALRALSDIGTYSAQEMVAKYQRKLKEDEKKK